MCMTFKIKNELLQLATANIKKRILIKGLKEKKIKFTLFFNYSHIVAENGTEKRDFVLLIPLYRVGTVSQLAFFFFKSMNFTLEFQFWNKICFSFSF